MPDSSISLSPNFKLTSGRHSDRYIEKFRLLENPIALDKICSAMADIYKEENIDLVASAAIGGILIAGGVGKHLNIKHIFSERVDFQWKVGFHGKPSPEPMNSMG